MDKLLRKLEENNLSFGAWRLPYTKELRTRDFSYEGWITCHISYYRAQAFEYRGRAKFALRDGDMSLARELLDLSTMYKLAVLELGGGFCWW